MGTIETLVTDADGTWREIRDEDTGAPIGRQLVEESPAFTAARETQRAANVAKAAKEGNNLQRIEVLGRRAARFAKDPAANAGDSFLNDAAGRRALHELLARLALAAATDDV